MAHVLEKASWSGLLLFVYLACGVAAIPLWLRLSARWGKHRTWTGAMILATGIFALVPLLGPGDQWWFLGVCIVTGMALGVGLAFPLLEATGFRAGAADQSPAALLALVLLYSLVPAAFKLAAIALYLRYPITAARQQRIRRLIEARHGPAALAAGQGGALQ